MALYKKIVKVVALCDEDAKLTPLFIIWDQQEKYKIDKILNVRKAASKAGGCGILYRCIIAGNIRHLFYEIDHWFIESSHP